MEQTPIVLVPCLLYGNEVVRRDGNDNRASCDMNILDIEAPFMVRRIDKLKLAGVSIDTRLFDL